MKVFTANFGRENYLWPSCVERNAITHFESEDLRPFWLAGDRDGFIARCLETKITAAGLKPTRSVASRWFNVTTTVCSTEGDLWLHREKDELWWTMSLKGNAEVSYEPSHEPERTGEFVYVLRKPAQPWSNRSRTGQPLKWRGLHGRARSFLFTEGTMQQLSTDNAEYAKRLVNGEDLSSWHSRKEWKATADSNGRGAVVSGTAKERAIARMVITARDTVAAANGQQVLRTLKNKELKLSTLELESHIRSLLHSQECLCAITGIALQFDGEAEDPELLCSLDRIRSDGHYELGNLQIVCKFVNRWKGASEDVEFRRLVELIRSQSLA